MESNKKTIVKTLTNLVKDKAYIKNQIKEGKSIDSTKLKAVKIAKVSL